MSSNNRCLVVNNVVRPTGESVVWSNSLSDYATTGNIPTKVSDLENDSGYLTEHQDLSEYAKSSDIPTKVSELENDGVYTTQKELYGAQDSADVAEAVLYNKETEEFVFVNPDDLSNYPVDTYTPIGVVAIPSSHDVYGTGEAGIISLVNMSCTTPNVGTTSMEFIYWGGYSFNTHLTHFTLVPQFGIASSQIDSLSATPYYAYLPSDNFTSTKSNVDPLAYYYNASAEAAPSPYLADGSRNPTYYMTDDIKYNALSDFDGIENTQSLLDLTSDENWKSSDTINNSLYAGYSPSALCIWRFHTEGTKQGDWYLPACGELGYAVVRQKAINATITALNNTYETIGLTIGDYLHWSSSEYNSNLARLIIFNSGAVVYSSKTNPAAIRAFLRLKPSSNPGILDSYIEKSELDNYIENFIHLDPSEIESYLNNTL